jgi:hypothetical protein
VVDYLAPVRERYASSAATRRARGGARGRRRAKARAIAAATLADVREAMGVGPPR